MGMTAILFNDAERFEQIDNIPSILSNTSNLVKIGQAVSEKKLKFYEILQHFPYTRIWECKFDLAIERSKVNLDSLFESTW